MDNKIPNYPESDHAAPKTFLEFYEQFVREHGTLYESKKVPLEESDIRTIELTYRVIFGFFALVGMGFFAMLYFNFPSAGNDMVYAVMMAAVFLGGSWWIYRWRVSSLKNGTKTVLKGIITSKKSDQFDESPDYTIRLSDREDINITQTDFKQYALGDIVQIELLGSRFFRPANPKVTLIHKLPGIPANFSERRNPDSIFAKAGRFVGRLLRGK